MEPATTNRPTVHVLLVEDNPADARLVQYMLSEASGSEFVITHVDRLSNAVDNAAKQTFDIALLDLSLPDSFGMETIDALQAAAPAIPIVVFTGREDEHFAVDAVKHGAQDYLVKGQGDGTLIARALRYAIQRHAAEADLKLASAVFQTTNEGIIVTGPDNRITRVNPAFTRLTGFSADDAIGQDPNILNSGHHDADFFKDMWTSLKSEGKWQGEIWNRKKNGEVFAEWLSINTIRTLDGRVQQYVAVFSDITERKKHEEIIRRQANYDALTDLPNRSLFHDRLSRSLSRARRDGLRVGLLFIDLDRFKWVNDTLGHRAGDELLRITAKRLRACVRESDTVARLGGDEFTVILPDLSQSWDTEMVATKILEQLVMAYPLEGKDIHISGSIGITIYPDDADDQDSLLRNADAAMYRAKESGRNAYCFFTPEMDKEIHRRADLERAMRDGLREKTFQLVYQPVFSLTDRKLVGAEALLRFPRKNGEVALPGEFLPLAEETGLIGPLGIWTIQTAIKRLAEWKQEGFRPPTIGINLSARHFRDAEFVSDLTVMLSSAGLSPSDISLEITEGLFLENIAGIDEQLNRLNELGFALILDDFGAGHSSIGHLRRFPIKGIKIDGTLIKSARGSSADAACLSAIISLANGLGLSVVAEGVEQEDDIRLLEGFGCPSAQGYAFGYPCAPDDFAAAYFPNLQNTSQSGRIPSPIINPGE